MSDYIASVMNRVQTTSPGEPEFHQAVHEVLDSLTVVMERHPEYKKARILEP